MSTQSFNPCEFGDMVAASGEVNGNARGSAVISLFVQTFRTYNEETSGFSQGQQRIQVVA